MDTTAATGTGTAPTVDAATETRNASERAEALQLINEYIIADNKQHTRNGIPENEFHQLSREKARLVASLVKLNDPLVQAIATKLLAERHSFNAMGMITKLADKVYRHSP